MSIEAAIEKLAAAIAAHAEAITATRTVHAAEVTTPVQTPAPTKARVKKSVVPTVEEATPEAEAPKEEQQEQEKDDSPEPTLEDCRRMMMEVSTAQGSQAAAMQLLQSLGFDKITQLDKTKYRQLIAAGNKLLGRE